MDEDPEKQVFRELLEECLNCLDNELSIYNRIEVALGYVDEPEEGEEDE